MGQIQSKEEKELLKVCRDKDADVSQFIPLLKQGARLNIHDEDGWHPLWWVSYHGRRDLVELFLEHNAEVDLPTANNSGETALMNAGFFGYIDIAKVLIGKGAFINYQNKDGYGVLYFACKNKRVHISLIRLLLDNGALVNKGTNTPLYTACLNGRLNVARILLEYGANVNQPCGVKPHSSPLIAACDDKYVQVVQLLIKNGANIDYQDSNGNTPLHHAIDGAHIEIIKQLLHSQASLDIKNNAGQTPLQLAEEKKYSEIVTLLKTRIPAGQLLDSVGVSGDDGEKEEELSVEELSEDETGHHYQLEVPKEGYVCIAQNSVCLLYLPQEISKTVLIETITDTSVRPKLASYEILITPIVRISCEKSSSLEKPAIIELVKTLQLADKEANNKVILLCASSDSSEWRESGSECRVLKNHISFQVTHFSLYAVISRKRYPSSTVRVKPSTDILAPHHSSTSTELAIPELPGFKVQIPPSSINANRETDITATVLYDSPVVCSEDDRSRLASSCIELRPHGITFSKAISISLPIPDHAEVKKNHPNAQLQIWHTNNLTKLEWNVIEYSIHRDVEGQDVAIVLTEHFSWYKPMWDAYNWTRSLFYAPQFSIKERCQVFMSQETQLQPSQDITFSIAVLFYPYKEDPEPVPCNYKYTLLDSGLLDIHATNDDTLQFEVQLNEQLSPKKCKSIAGSLIISGRQQKSFIVELDRQVKLQENFPMGELSVGVREHIYHTLSLIKPVDMTSGEVSSQVAPLSSTATASAYQFEKSIVAIEDAAEKLSKDVTGRDEDNAGPMVEAAKSIASMWMKMAQLIRKECVLKEKRFKEDIVDLAKNINKESQEVMGIATSTAEACTDRIMKNAVYEVVERIETISHQLSILAAGEASRQRDEASDLEACRMLTDNATNIISAILEALNYTRSASIRVAVETRKELGLTHYMETDPITGKLSQYHKVKDNRESDHQDFHDGSSDHTQSFSSSRGHLSPNDLQRVQNSIWEARVQWYNLGLGLDITPDSLDAIEVANTGKPDRCFRAMLIQWLREHHRPTWSALAEALRSPSVGRGHLAQQILQQNSFDTMSVVQL